MTLQGKGFIINNLSECEDGEPNSILAAAQSAGISHIVIKIADGEQASGLDTSGVDLVAPVVQALKQAGIEVWGWHSVFGNNPAAEVAMGMERVQVLGLNGYVVCAGDEYTRPGMASTARQFMLGLRNSLTVPIALSSFRFPNYHPEFPWSTFLEFCDVHMPQVSWEQAHNAGEQLRESKRQCDDLPNARTYIPTGPAYRVSGWDPSAEEINDFLTTAVALELPAINFYDWVDCRKDLPLLWAAIAGFTWPAASQTDRLFPATNRQPLSIIPDAFLSQFLEALNSRQAAQAGVLYDPAAIQVRADQILTGTGAIQSGYDAFFDSLPAGTIHYFTQAEVADDTRQFSWNAGPITGETTLVLKNGKIILDYTFLYQPD